MHTCQEQAAVSGVHLDLCIQFAACILEAVALINDDVLPGQLGQARPVDLAHHEVIAGQQHIKAGLAPSNLHQESTDQGHQGQGSVDFLVSKHAYSCKVWVEYSYAIARNCSSDAASKHDARPH